MLIANNVQILNKEVDFLFTSEDVKKIKKFAHQKGGVRFFYRTCMHIQYKPVSHIFIHLFE